MKKIIVAFVALLALVCAPAAQAQFNLAKALSAGKKAAQAMTLSDSDMAAYARQSVVYMDSTNKVSSPTSTYSRRLATLTRGLTQADGIPLNFKVYEVTDVNAFACPDGSVRVFSALMDILDDDELLGVIGHEIGHVACHHSKNAFKQELLRSALLDAAGSTSEKVAALTESQLCAMGEALAGARYSQKQEKEADDYGYNFLKSNGRNPWGMVRSFEKLEQVSGGSGARPDYIQKMFSSHPDTRDRIKRLSARAKRDGIPRGAK